MKPFYMNSELIGILKIGLTIVILTVSVILFKLSKDYIDDNEEENEEEEEK